VHSLAGTGSLIGIKGLAFDKNVYLCSTIRRKLRKKNYITNATE
jgi:hypothetical protein